MKTIDDLLNHAKKEPREPTFHELTSEFMQSDTGIVIDAGGRSPEELYHYLKGTWTCDTKTAETIQESGWVTFEEI